MYQERQRERKKEKNEIDKMRRERGGIQRERERQIGER